MFPVLLGICGLKRTTWKRGSGRASGIGAFGILPVPMWPVLFANAAWVVFLSIWALVYLAGARTERDSAGGK
jgi:hypothetical protein